MKWYGFTNDEIFGSIMSNTRYCKAILEAVLPEIKIAEIKSIVPQKVMGTTIDPSSRDVRLDIAVTDINGNLYDVEMQVTKNKGLGKRIRYYQSSMDRDTLDKGEAYMYLKNTYLVFLCPFDPFNVGKLRYSFHLYDDSDKSVILPTNAETIIINSKGNDSEANKALLNLKKLINNVPVTSKDVFREIEETIISYNHDPKRRILMRSAELRLKEAIGETRLEEQEKARIEQKKKLKKNDLKTVKATVELLKSMRSKITREEIVDILKDKYQINVGDPDISSSIDKAFKK